MERLRTLLLGLLFLSVGFLLGSLWLEWRGSPAGGSATVARRSVASSLPEEMRTRVRVEVLNGAGEAGAARSSARRLRDMGFDVVYFGNAESFDHERTVVLDRSGRPGAARRLADSLGLRDVLERLAPELYVDATLVLGADWRRRLEGSGARPSGEGGREERARSRREEEGREGLFERLFGGGDF